MRSGGDNIMVILSSPSGVGKTTLTKKIQQKNQSFKISVSHTTRKPRSNEVDGVDYFFIKKNEFERLIKENQFYEHAKIFENYYGTLKKNVDETIINNDIIFDIDWQGTIQLSKIKSLNLVKIYLITKNKGELKSDELQEGLQLVLYDGYRYEEIVQKKKSKKNPHNRISFQQYTMNIDLRSFNDDDLNETNYKIFGTRC